ncbi:MAG: cellulase family glycosylhydrolase [Patescibacteria group bacterium]
MLLQVLVPHTQAAAKHEVGISTGATLLRMKDRTLDRRLIDIERLGATWIRVDFNWPAIQPHNAKSYDWKIYDRVVRVAGAHNLKILGTLAYTPRWAQEPRCAKLVITLAAGQKCNPKSTEAFARFARSAALRYKGKNVRAWEIWNEPNLSSYWKTAQPPNNPVRNAVHADPVAYAKFANAAAYQIRRNAPNTLVITGGLAPLWEPKYPKGLRQSDYLAQLLPRLNPALFDGVGIHPYSWPTLPDRAVIHNAFHSVDQGRTRFNLRAIMEKNGFGAKQMWGTEYGAPTNGVSRAHERPDHVSEALQAQIIAGGIRNWYAKPNVGPLIVHSDSDQWLRKRKNENSFGLRRTDGTQKPAYRAFQNAAKGL